VWICQILQEISQKRTRERMSDQEAKEIKAEAREIMPQPSTEREEMEGQDEDEEGSREDGKSSRLRAWILLNWMAACGVYQGGFRAVGQIRGLVLAVKFALE
ncbi:hypothetical protein Tco_1038158, partial [Tanacetum coccineum]